MEIFNSRRIASIGVVAAIYVVLTLLCSSFAYGQVQFRISECLILLCFFNRDYIISMTLGCFITNIFSSVGPIDTVVGTLHTLISVAVIFACRNKLPLWAASLSPSIFGFIIAIELKYVFGLPFFASWGWIALGEFVCVTILGVVLMTALSKNKQFMKLIMAGHNVDYFR